ncbi:DNA repair helicase [Meira miltonrushii]|uniref:ATP-dependent DNA helicase CHL1 n=1 Tax=Meira miltonrushii TaxID=1280837 RepID=A0A316V928_9BASI|nr:DNA repair helicase [Meira miltonrushii]PWN33962.1 DNA repair helicase [Meira miltonrushii]
MNEDSLRQSSRAFHFPYPKAYSIQLDLMRAVFTAIEDEKVGIFESPTGTGKSLSLICGACTWLEANAKRHEQGQLKGSVDDEEPDWVREHESNRQMEALQSHEKELQSRIEAARIRLEERRKNSATSIKRTKVSRTGISNSDSEDEYLVEDNDQRTANTSNAARPDDPSSFLSPAVRALMEKSGAYMGNSKGKKIPFYAKQGNERDEEDEPETVPKIIYVSRTHSQVSQFINEVKRTDFAVAGNRDSNRFSVRNTSLGGRKQMCINQSVIDIGQRAGIEAMNEKCLDLMKRKKGSTSKAGCEYLPAPDEAGQLKLMEYRDTVLADVHDIEDAVKIGKEMHICSYFGARGSARQAHIVTMPYNLLLNASARDSLNIELKGAIVIIDEAHNLIDTILATHTVLVSSWQIQRAISQINDYLDKFSSRLKGTNEINLQKLLLTLRSLDTSCTNAVQNKAQSMTPAELMRKIGGNIDQINLLELDRWLRETKIARKIAGYADRKLRVEASTEETMQRVSHSGISALHTIESFLLALTNRDLDGRIYFSTTSELAKNGEKQWSLKYQLLNPAEVFSDIVKDARSVILAGGTMEPISDFAMQLFPALDPERLTHFSCSHIIPKQNLMAAIVCKTAKGTPLSFRYDARGDATIMEELTGMLVNYCNVIPHGVVVFVPSYGFLDSLQEHWKTSPQFVRLKAKKQVYFEPKTASEVDTVLRGYGRSIDQDQGAILFAVVGAKLSEGINFSDRLARAVIMVGMPFANINSPELKERMNYVRALHKQQKSGTLLKQKEHKTDFDAGQELYINLCMKAVNQAMGRAIRHQNDFAALIFLDNRYSRQDTIARLPSWIVESTKVYDTFGPSIGALGAFFRAKKTAPQT